MITCVYSMSCGSSSSRSSSCAAPRMPPSGRVLDLVREAADQLAVRLLLLVQPLLARHLELLVDVAELEQHAAFAVVERRRRAAQVQPRLAAGAELDLLLGVRRARRDGLGDRRLERGARAEELRGAVPDELLARKLEQVLGRRVRPLHASVAREQQHGRREQLQPRARCRDGGFEERDPDHGGLARAARAMRLAVSP